MSSEEYNIFLLVHEDNLQFLVVIEHLEDIIFLEVLLVVSGMVHLLELFHDLVQVHLLGVCLVHNGSHIVDHGRHDVRVRVIAVYKKGKE